MRGPAESKFPLAPLRSDPHDHVSWGTMALAADNPRYRCLTNEYGPVTACQLDLSTIDAFDHPVDGRSGYWETQAWGSGDGGIPLVDAHTDAPPGQLRIDYDWSGNADAWFIVRRTQDVTLQITDQFQLIFDLSSKALNPSSIGPRFEVKLGTQNGCVYWKSFTLGAPEATRRTVRLGYADFSEFDTNCHPDAALPELKNTRIVAIEFALNRNMDATLPTSGALEIGPIRYADQGVLATVQGFAGSEHDLPNRLLIEGTAAMATSYCLVGTCSDGSYTFYMNELSRLLSVTSGMGLPSEVKQGQNRFPANAGASAWFVLADRCIDPFAPAGLHPQGPP